MNERPRTDLPLVRGVHDPASTAPPAQPEPFAQALDALLRAWSLGQQPTRDELRAASPGLADEVDAVFELAREIAVVRPQALPTVPGYDVLEEIGRGGMGVVYRARQQGLSRIVALKVLPDAGDGRGRSRFLAEARSIGRLRHDHVVTIHEVIETADLCAYAMEWVDGRSLASLLEELAGWPRRSPLPTAVTFGGADAATLPDPIVPWLCRTGIAIARALAAVHAHGLVHRDVKPSNVLLRSDGTALLSDFGLVRTADLGLTRTGQIVGTPVFAAPEQLRGDTDVGPQADVWSLGATLHCAFAATVPFAGRTPHELLASVAARRRQPLTTLGLPRDLETIVGRCLEPEPRDRYASAAAVAEDLENLLALRPVTARPLGPLARSWRLLRRNRRLVVAAAASAMLVFAACAMLALWAWNAFSLPGRFDAEVLAARFALLEPTHEERVELADQGKGPARASVFEQSGDLALAAYDRALALDASRTDILAERHTVAASQQLLQSKPLALSPELQALAPRTAALAVAWSGGATTPTAPLDGASDLDRRLYGLLAFLCGKASECHAAWGPLEMGNDPFVDAASGQMHLQRDDAPKAAMRLSRAAQVWPQAGFLAIGLADCAVRLGDLDVADRELARAERLGHKNTFDTQVRVRADLHAARGDVEAARRDYEWMIEHHVATVARRHYLELLERQGDRGPVADLMLDEWRRGAVTPAKPALAAWQWWCSLSWEQRTAAIATLCDANTDGGRLFRVGLALPAWRDFAESRTADSRPGSAEFHEAVFGLQSLIERTPMHPEIRLNLDSTSGLGIAVTRGLGIAADPRVLRLAPLRASAIAIARIAIAAWAIASGVASTASAQTAEWTLEAPATSPSARRAFATALDPLSGAVLVCGGYDDATATQHSDMWAWNGANWNLAGTTPGGAPLVSAQMCTVSSLGKVLLFGGGSGTTYPSDTWLWDGLTWSNVSLLSGTTPPTRVLFAMAYDASRDRVVMHSGLGGSSGSTQLTDTWEWNPANYQWTIVSSSGPARYDHALSYDPARGYVVLHGGVIGSTHINETWTWDGFAWSQRANTAPSSMARRYCAMAWDDSRQRLVQFGGTNASFAFVSEVREWDGQSWSPSPVAVTSPQAPTPRGILSMQFHPGSNRMVVFGGYLPTTPPSTSNQTWTLATQYPTTAEATGPGCLSETTNLTPSLSRVQGTGPWLGGQLTLRLDGLATSPQYAHVLTIDATNPAASIGLPLSPAGCVLRVGLAYQQFFLLHGGFASIDLSMPPPSTTSLLGVQFYAQGATVNTTGAPYLIDAVSNGMQFTIGTR